MSDILANLGIATTERSLCARLRGRQRRLLSTARGSGSMVPGEVITVRLSRLYTGQKQVLTATHQSVSLCLCPLLTRPIRGKSR